ncbi:hypothetical protein ACFL4K_02415 [Candidatus Neomarinimicrobiota bacterium]
MDSCVKILGEYQLTNALNLMVNKGERFLTYQVEQWLDCSTSETLLATNAVLLKGGDG